MSGGRVVVVGGGLAGISAALDLAAAGAGVTLVEVRPRLGGAAYSIERDGVSIDNGQHVFLRCCVEYRRFLERIGATGSTVLQRRLDIPVLAPGGRRHNLRRAPLPAPLHLAPALLRYGYLSPPARARAARTALALARLDLGDPSLDDTSFERWLRDRGEGDAAIAALWNLIALPTLNVPAGRASLALAVKVFQTGLLSSSAAGDIGYSAVPLSQLHGPPAERALRAQGVEIRLSTRAERIEPVDGRFDVDAGGETISADAVVVALPHARAARLLPDGALEDPARLERLGSSPIVNLHVVYDRRVTDLPLAAAVDSPVQWIFDRSANGDFEAGQYVAVSLSGAEREMRMSQTELQEEFVPALAELLPSARSAKVERFMVTREHAATFSAVPGVASLRPGPRTRLPGLALAGSWTDTGWPATMESAVRSGVAAAQEALRGRQSGTAAERQAVTR